MENYMFESTQLPEGKISLEVNTAKTDAEGIVKYKARYELNGYTQICMWITASWRRYFEKC